MLTMDQTARDLDDDCDFGAHEFSRVSKRDLIVRVARNTGLTTGLVATVYNELINELVRTVHAGDTVVLTGFGRFYRQFHKGHRVRFGQTTVKDYPVLKFSASKALNKRLNGAAPVVEEVDHSRPDTAA